MITTSYFDTIVVLRVNTGSIYDNLESNSVNLNIEIAGKQVFLVVSIVFLSMSFLDP